MFGVIALFISQFEIIVGERWERRLWREERPERVAAVGVQRRRTVAKAHTGHRNRGATLALPVADKARGLSVPRSNLDAAVRGKERVGHRKRGATGAPPKVATL